MPISFSLKKYKNQVFVETGTYKGDGVRKALRAGFKKIYSIELGEELYKNAMVVFAKEVEEGRVELVLGASSACLPDILKKIDQRITFWLDAHFSSGDTARGPEDVPLLEEFNIIARHPINKHTILIDDIRLFGKKNPEDWSNIHLNLVIEKLKSINKNYSIHYENGAVKNDILVAEIYTPNIYKILGRLEELTDPIIRKIIYWIKWFRKLLSKIKIVHSYPANLNSRNRLHKPKNPQANTENTDKKTSWSDAKEGYLTVCKLAAGDDGVFRIFKRSKDYRTILEHVTKKQGEDYLNLIKQQGADLLNYFSKFKENDIWGSPIKYKFEFGEFSPTTLRYIKILADLKNLFKSLDGFNIVEIGAGYGGQCKIISDVFDYSSYTIIDLDSVLPLIKKYLAKLAVENVTFQALPQITGDKKYDLVISNYAFSECARHTQDEYIEKILSKSTRGYLTCNYDGVSSLEVPYNKEELHRILSKKHPIQIVDEKPKTGKFNFVIIWNDIEK